MDSTDGGHDAGWLPLGQGGGESWHWSAKQTHVDSVASYFSSLERERAELSSGTSKGRMASQGGFHRAREVVRAGSGVLSEPRSTLSYNSPLGRERAGMSARARKGGSMANQGGGESWLWRAEHAQAESVSLQLLGED